MKIKFCGVCRPEDAATAARLGADYIGVILSTGFPRSQSNEKAKVIYRDAAMNAMIRRVGVFVDAPIEEITNAIQELKLDVVQLHGNENAAFINDLRSGNPGIEIWKAIRASTKVDVEVARRNYEDITDGFLVDRNKDAQFEHRELRGHRGKNKKLIIAGSLTPDNVTKIIAETNADVADVSSGIEEQLGIKSESLMKQFIENARR